MIEVATFAEKPWHFHTTELFERLLESLRVEVEHLARQLETERNISPYYARIFAILDIDGRRTEAAEALKHALALARPDKSRPGQQSLLDRGAA